MAIVVLVGASFDIVDELCVFPPTPRNCGGDVISSTHLINVAGFLMTAMAGIFESYGRLPLNAHKGAAAVALFIEGVNFLPHAEMFAVPGHATAHRVLAYICLGGSGAFALVAAFPLNVFQVMVVVMVTLQGVWYFYIGVALYTTAIYSEVDSYSDAEGSNASRENIRPSPGNVQEAFCILLLVIFSVFGAAFACCAGGASGFDVDRCSDQEHGIHDAIDRQEPCTTQDREEACLVERADQRDTELSGGKHVRTVSVRC